MQWPDPPPANAHITPCLHCTCLLLCPAVLNYLYSKKKLGLVDLVSTDPDRTVLVANYIHSIHMEV